MVKNPPKQPVVDKRKKKKKSAGPAGALPKSFLRYCVTHLKTIYQKNQQSKATTYYANANTFPYKENHTTKGCNFQTSIIANALLKLNFTKIQTAINILSNHNTLNYHMEKCGLALSPHCDYCTDVTKEIDANWDIKCLETSCHILCKCKYFSTQRASYYLAVFYTPHISHSSGGAR